MVMDAGRDKPGFNPPLQKQKLNQPLETASSPAPFTPSAGPSKDIFVSVKRFEPSVHFGQGSDSPSNKSVTSSNPPTAHAVPGTIRTMREKGVLIISDQLNKGHEIAASLMSEAMNPKLFTPGSSPSRTMSSLNASKEPAALPSYPVLSGNLDKMTREQFPVAGFILEDSADATMSVKKTVLKNLERLASPETVLATRPVPGRLQDVTDGLANPERVVGMRFFQPAQKVKVVELVASPLTSPDALDTARKLVRAMGKVAVVSTKDSPGAISDRLTLNLQVEALRLLQEGWGSADEIDSVSLKLLSKESNESGDSKGASAKTKNAPKGTFPLLKNVSGQGTDLYDAMKQLSSLDAFYGVPAIMQSEFKRIQEFKRTASSDVTNDPQTRFFPDGLPKVVAADKAKLPLKARREVIANRLTGSLFANVLKMVQEGLCQPEDIETITRMGFNWRTGPFSAMNEIKSGKVEAALKAFENSFTTPVALPSHPVGQRVMPGVKGEARNGVYTITLNRPYELNTLNIDVLEKVIEHVEAAEKDPNVKAIVLDSNSGKVFSGGADLSMFKDAPSVEIFRWGVDRGKELVNRIATSSKLTVAKVQGPTYGASTELALAFDRLVVTEDFSMKLPEVNIGLAPVWGGTERMIQKIGRPLAKAIILNGKFDIGLVKQLPKLFQKLVNGPLNLDIDKDPGFAIDSKTAKTLGLVDDVTSRQLLDDHVEALLSRPESLVKPDPNRGDKRYKAIEDYPTEVQSAYRLKDIEAETGKKLGRFSKRARPLAIRLMEQVGTPKEGHLTDADYKQMAEDTKAKISKIYVLKDMALAIRDKKLFSFMNHLYSVIRK